MSRSKQITYENLRMRDAKLVAEVDRWWTRRVAEAEGVRLPKDFAPPPPMFSPFTLRGMSCGTRSW